MKPSPRPPSVLNLRLLALLAVLPTTACPPPVSPGDTGGGSDVVRPADVVTASDVAADVRSANDVAARADAVGDVAAISPGPEGGDNALIVIDGAGIPGNIDDRDMDVTTFDTTFVTPERGDQYTIMIPVGQTAIGVSAKPDGALANIIDYTVQAKPDTNNPDNLYFSADRGAVGGSECLTIDSNNLVGFTPAAFPAGAWTVRVLTFHGLPTPDQLAAGSSMYIVRAQTGSVCTFL